jgi:predicted nucleotidyltransferase
MTNKSFNIDYEIILLLINEGLHGRAISNRLKANLSSVQNHLKLLRDLNVIDYKTIGKNKIFNIKNSLSSRKYVYNAENYKLLLLIEKYPFLEPLITDINKSNVDMIILFGSFASLTANDDSDIDVFAQTQKKDLKKALESINSRLSIKIGTFDVNSLLIKEIIKNHVILKGVETYYERVGFFK